MGFFRKKDKKDTTLLMYCPLCDSFTKVNDEFKCESCNSPSTRGLALDMLHNPRVSKENGDLLWEMEIGFEDNQSLLAYEWNSMSSVERESRLNAARDDAVAFLNYCDDVLARSGIDNPIQD